MMGRCRRLWTHCLVQVVYTASTAVSCVILLALRHHSACNACPFYVAVFELRCLLGWCSPESFDDRGSPSPGKPQLNGSAMLSGGSIVLPGNSHPKARMPGQMCVEIANGDAKGYYGRLMAKLAANLGKWGKATPHHWKAMLIKVRWTCGRCIDGLGYLGDVRTRVPCAGGL